MTSWPAAPGRGPPPSTGTPAAASSRHQAARSIPSRRKERWWTPFPPPARKRLTGLSGEVPSSTSMRVPPTDRKDSRTFSPATSSAGEASARKTFFSASRAGSSCGTARAMWSSERRGGTSIAPRARPRALPDEGDDVRERGAGGEDSPVPGGGQGVVVLGGDDSSAKEDHPFEVDAGLPERLRHLREERQVRPREVRDADRVDVLLQRRARDRLRRGADAGVDHLHPRIPQRAQDHLDAPVMAIESGLGEEPA